MKIVVSVDRNDGVDVDVNKFGQVTVNIGDVEIYFENKKDAINFMTELETALCDGDTKSDLEDQVSDLENEVEGLKEKIADLENELDDAVNGDGGILQ